jgi:hypothetical protein
MSGGAARVIERWHALRVTPGPIDPHQLDTLWADLEAVGFRGEVTATVVYDGMAVLDHFKRVDDNTPMGVVNGKPGVVLASSILHSTIRPSGVES